MSLYDLRYTKAPSTKQKKAKIATIPYRRFPWENTSFRYGLGFDYNSELGIIATASSSCRYHSDCFPSTGNDLSTLC